MTVEKIVKPFDDSLSFEKNEIFNITQRTVVPVHQTKDGGRFVLLKKDGKMTKINYGLLVLNTFNKFELPKDLWHLVDLGFINGNREDYSLPNLSLKYPKGGIEHHEIKGFYYIPGFENNLINREGVVYNIIKMGYNKPKSNIERLTQKINYSSSNVRNNCGTSKSKPTHRLLALTFLEPPENHPELVVNHINGKKDDYSLDNLEWATFKYNSRHALMTGLNACGNKILVKDTKTGTVTEYHTMAELSRKFDVHPQNITYAKNNPNQMYKRRYIIKDYDDERPWSYFESQIISYKSVRVKARDVFTGEIKHFPSVKNASKAIKGSQVTIAQYFRRNSKPCIINGHEWKLEDDQTPWTEFNEYDLEISRRNLRRETRVYKLTNQKTKEEFICFGWRAVSKISKHSKMTIMRSVKWGVEQLSNDYKLEILH